MTVQLENSIPKPILFKILNQDLDKAYEKYGIALYAMAYTGLCISIPMIMGLLSSQLDDGEDVETLVYRIGLLVDTGELDASAAMLITLALSFMETSGERYYE